MFILDILILEIYKSYDCVIIVNDKLLYGQYLSIYYCFKWNLFSIVSSLLGCLSIMPLSNDDYESKMLNLPDCFMFN